MCTVSPGLRLCNRSEGTSSIRRIYFNQRGMTESGSNRRHHQRTLFICQTGQHNHKGIVGSDLLLICSVCLAGRLTLFRCAKRCGG
jgi:hypothetical protein